MFIPQQARAIVGRRLAWMDGERERRLRGSSLSAAVATCVRIGAVEPLLEGNDGGNQGVVRCLGSV